MSVGLVTAGGTAMLGSELVLVHPAVATDCKLGIHKWCIVVFGL